MQLQQNYYGLNKYASTQHRIIRHTQIMPEISLLESITHNTQAVCDNKMLSYRRETALHGALFLAK